MRRKTQISLFLVIGLIILAVFGLSIFLSSSREVYTGEQDAIQIVALGADKEIITSYVEECLKQRIQEGIDEFGLKEAQLRGYVQARLMDCIDEEELRDNGIAVSFGEVDVRVEVESEAVIVKLHFPVSLSKKDSEVNFDTFLLDYPRKVVALLPVDKEGRLKKSVKAQTTDEDIEITVREGTIALDKEGNPVQEVTIKILDNYNPRLRKHGLVAGPTIYDAQPSGATFDPPLIVKIHYEEKDIPAGVQENDLKLYYLNEATGDWIPYPSAVDLIENYVIARVSHFTPMALGGNLQLNPIIVFKDDGCPEGYNPNGEFLPAEGEVQWAWCNDCTRHKSNDEWMILCSQGSDAILVGSENRSEEATPPPGEGTPGTPGTPSTPGGTIGPGDDCAGRELDGKACNRSDSNQKCSAQITVRVYYDKGCDRYFDSIDRPITDAIVHIRGPGCAGSKETNTGGFIVFNNLNFFSPDEAYTISASLPDGYSLCSNQYSEKRFYKRSIGPMGSAYYPIRAQKVQEAADTGSGSGTGGSSGSADEGEAVGDVPPEIDDLVDACGEGYSLSGAFRAEELVDFYGTELKKGYGLICSKKDTVRLYGGAEANPTESDPDSWKTLCPDPRYEFKDLDPDESNKFILGLSGFFHGLKFFQDPEKTEQAYGVDYEHNYVEENNILSLCTDTIYCGSSVIGEGNLFPGCKCPGGSKYKKAYEKDGKIYYKCDPPADEDVALDCDAATPCDTVFMKNGVRHYCRKLGVHAEYTWTSRNMRSGQSCTAAELGDYGICEHKVIECWYDTDNDKYEWTEIGGKGDCGNCKYDNSGTCDWYYGRQLCPASCRLMSEKDNCGSCNHECTGTNAYCKFDEQHAEFSCGTCSHDLTTRVCDDNTIEECITDEDDSSCCESSACVFDGRCFPDPSAGEPMEESFADINKDGIKESICYDGTWYDVDHPHPDADPASVCSDADDVNNFPCEGANCHVFAEFRDHSSGFGGYAYAEIIDHARRNNDGAREECCGDDSAENWYCYTPATGDDQCRCCPDGFLSVRPWQEDIDDPSSETFFVCSTEAPGSTGTGKCQKYGQEWDSGSCLEDNDEKTGEYCDEAGDVVLNRCFGKNGELGGGDDCCPDQSLCDDDVDSDTYGQCVRSCNGVSECGDPEGYYTCTGGKCVCSSKEEIKFCRGSCVDTSSDDKNCGVCGRECACEEGECTGGSTPSPGEGDNACTQAGEENKVDFDGSDNGINPFCDMEELCPDPEEGMEEECGDECGYIDAESYCCGDDTHEYYHAYSSGIEACCSSRSDCVWEDGLCYGEDTLKQTANGIEKVCKGGLWTGGDECMGISANQNPQDGDINKVVCEDYTGCGTPNNGVSADDCPAEGECRWNIRFDQRTKGNCCGDDANEVPAKQDDHWYCCPGVKYAVTAPDSADARYCSIVDETAENEGTCQDEKDNDGDQQIDWSKNYKLRGKPTYTGDVPGDSNCVIKLDYMSYECKRDGTRYLLYVKCGYSSQPDPIEIEYLKGIKTTIKVGSDESNANLIPMNPLTLENNRRLAEFDFRLNGYNNGDELTIVCKGDTGYLTADPADGLSGTVTIRRDDNDVITCTHGEVTPPDHGGEGCDDGQGLDIDESSCTAACTGAKQGWIEDDSHHTFQSGEENCCGDDAGEYLIRHNVVDDEVDNNDDPAVPSTPDSYACCSESSSCVGGDWWMANPTYCCFDQGTLFQAFNDIDICGTASRDNLHQQDVVNGWYCDQGTWTDLDTNAELCKGQRSDDQNIWWAPCGESEDDCKLLGEYANSGGNSECCGDDKGEFFKYYDTNGNGRYEEDGDEGRCCNSRFDEVVVDNQDNYICMIPDTDQRDATGNIHVNPDSHLQEIINNVAGEGDTIIFHGGTYHPAPSGDPSSALSLSKSLTLKSAGDGEVIIDANGADYGLYLQADTIVVEGLTVQGASSANIYVVADVVTLSHNKIQEGSVNGIDLIGAKGVAIRYNEISGNSLSGIAFYGQSEGNVLHNIVSDNSGVGIFGDKSEIRIASNIIEGNVGGIQIQGGSRANIKNNVIRNNKKWTTNDQSTIASGIVLSGADSTITNPDDFSNVFYDNQGGNCQSMFGNNFFSPDEPTTKQKCPDS